MAKPAQYTFEYKEVAEALVKAAGIHEGLWGIYIEFGISGTNIGPNENDLKPAALVPVMRIGLQQFPALNNMAVDAAVVNPPPAK